MNKKCLKQIIGGVISKLITLNESYLDSERLCRAIDEHIKKKGESIDSKKLAGKMESVLMDLYMSRRILPDVLNGNGYIIALNSEETLASLNELYERSVSVTSPLMVCLPSMLSSVEDAVQDLNSLDEKTKQVVDDVAHNYVENLTDLKDVFPEFV